MGYYKTKIKIQGKKDSTSNFFKLEETASDDKFTTFEQNDEEMRKWNFLEVKT